VNRKPTDRDYLTLNIVNGADLRIFATQRAILEEAPLFAAFFASEHYLRGAAYTITLPRQSPACIHVALRVLIRLDLYTPDDLRRYVGQYFHADQVVFLARLCRLGVHLRVDLLEGLARDLLIEIAHLVTPEDCVALVGIIYNGGAAPSAFLRAYVLAAVKQHVRALREDEQWEGVVRESGPALAVDLEGVLEGDVGMEEEEGEEEGGGA